MSVNKGTWSQPIGKHAPTSGSVTCIYVNADVVYVAINNILHIRRNETWQKHTLPNESQITCICCALIDLVFIGSINGLYFIINNNPPLAVTQSLFKTYITCLFNDGDLVFVGTKENGLLRCEWESENIWAFPNSKLTPPHKELNHITCLDGYSNSVYVGTHNAGLWILRDKGATWTQVPGISSKSDIQFIYNNDTTIYVGTKGEGLWSQPLYEIPPNRQLLDCWDTVKQRIYDIRHGLNIEGKRDILPLFSPPINPMELVEQAASGQGVSETQGYSDMEIPYYRFTVMIEKAKEITQTVIQLGQSLLAALEKKDAEQLAMLYNTNQQHILELNKSIKKAQLSAAKHTIASLQAGLNGAQNRLNHYTRLIKNDLTPGEKAELNLSNKAITVQSKIEDVEIAAAVLFLMPNIFGLSDGGMNFGQSVQQGASAAQSAGSLHGMRSGLAGTKASFQRRGQDWLLQETMARDDIQQIQYRILSAQYQENQAEQEITLLDKNMEQTKNIEGFYKRKFTNVQLYRWYAGKVSALYFQAYHLAYETAVQAENAWRFERMGRVEEAPTTGFIKPGIWDGLHQGLLAGSALMLDLQRMGKLFYEQNEHRLEIEKTISLAQLDPMALVDLKSKGSCVFDIVEKDFAFDFPGHYCRQIKSLSITLPMVLGPYQNIHATLTQLSNRIIVSDDGSGEKAVKHLLKPSDYRTAGPALKVDVRPNNQQVAISKGVNDSGLFELNFHDERYLPFEGTGAASVWALDIPFAENAIDFDALTDVIIQMKYTALSGSLAYKKAVEDNRGDYAGKHMISLAQEYPGEWNGFMNQTNSEPMKISINPQSLRRNQKDYEITKLSLIGHGDGAQLSMKSLTLIIQTDGDTAISFSNWNPVHNTKTGVWTIATGDVPKGGIALAITPEKLTLEVKNSEKMPKSLKNLILLIDFSCKEAK